MTGKTTSKRKRGTAPVTRTREARVIQPTPFSLSLNQGKRREAESRRTAAQATRKVLGRRGWPPHCAANSPRCSLEASHCSSPRAPAPVTGSLQLGSVSPVQFNRCPPNRRLHLLSSVSTSRTHCGCRISRPRWTRCVRFDWLQVAGPIAGGALKGALQLPSSGSWRLSSSVTFPLADTYTLLRGDRCASQKSLI